jgi:serine/threonine protein phosphatase PrpC
MYGIFTFTECGSHATNQDAFAITVHPDDASCCVCVLADGQGGRTGGRAAARTACCVTMKKALSYSPKKLARPSSWPSILRAADNAVRDSADAGYTTLVAACIVPSMVCGASSGDSAAIVLTGGNDHHRLTGNQIKNPPVGSGLAAFVPFSSRLVAPWVVLLMSDGVWKYTGWRKIVSAITQFNGQAMIDALQHCARLPCSGNFLDDFTVVAVQNQRNKQTNRCRNSWDGPASRVHTYSPIG